MEECTFPPPAPLLQPHGADASSASHAHGYLSIGAVAYGAACRPLPCSSTTATSLAQLSSEADKVGRCRSSR
jgi:hypothetical protein